MSRVPQFGAHLPNAPISDIYDAVSYANDNGFDSVWLGDHLVGTGIKVWDAVEPFPTLAAVASRTRLKLGISVVDAARRHPAVLAQNIVTLDHISNGRLIVGIGAGMSPSIKPFGIRWDKPVSMMEETIKIIKKFFSGGTIDYDGEFYKLKNAFLLPLPFQQPHPPFWIAANSPRTRRITAELGDGWLPQALNPEEYKKYWEEIEKHAKKVGRDPEEIVRANTIYTYISKKKGEEPNPIELPAKMLSAFWPETLKKVGFEVPEEFGLDKFTYSPESIRRVIDFASKVPFEAIEDRFIYGTPDECIERIDKLYKAGNYYYVCILLVPTKHRKSQYEIWGKKIIPYFKEQYG
ncbi:MAG: LLM class flavin-dependent oxidoreductase [Candidatus Freyrarchaeum guaymaensis]